MKWLAVLLVLLSTGAQAHCFSLAETVSFGFCGEGGTVYPLTWVFILWLFVVITFGLLLFNPRVHLLIKVVLFMLALPVSPVLLPSLFALQWLQQRLGWLQPLAAPKQQAQEPAMLVAGTGIGGQTDLPTPLLQLGQWQLNPVTHQLGVEDEWQTLEPKVYQLLAYFIEHQGRVISLEELHQNIWTGQVVTDTAVRRSISKLRHALGDTDAKNPRFIHSVMKRGYRFVMD
ncbi:winged helix-turn-helix domain-containing protein [Alkalimonas amylolytica]|uniref:Transcriptional regulatory protein, C terminal n=1 Tax=Alkalimonas amylolytica TaxID=152573 RepID=A0A1H4D580_ALKAM|nr:winged helix-turn-helix domain-containing protein [Alkalimonas amylolytica]SEA67983.1 Transcriptional regulatory protein, C terminal [Alkalimonas amylolytica]